MLAVEYERRFQNHFIFALALLPTKQHRIDKLRDGLHHEIRKG